MTTTNRGLNTIQLTLLKLFDKDMSLQEESDIHKMLMEYYEQDLQMELDKVVKNKKITQKDLDVVLNQSNRTK